MNRDQMRRNMAEAEQFEADLEDAEEGMLSEAIRERRERIDADEFGSPEALITHAVDVREVIGLKRRRWKPTPARSLPIRSSWPCRPRTFGRAFGTEWFIRPRGGAGRRANPSPTTLFPAG